MRSDELDCSSSDNLGDRLRIGRIFPENIGLARSMPI
jgi:hypothetical protein